MEEEEESSMGGHRLSNCELLKLGEDEWQELHDPEKSYALTVTRLVEYMGLGYDAPWKVCKKKEHNDFVKSLLDYGRNMEKIASRVFELFVGHYHYDHCHIPGKSDIYCRVVGPFLTNEYRRDLNKYPMYLAGHGVLYGSPDMILCKKNMKRVVEIKCPRESICLASVNTREDLLALYKEKAYINSKNPRILKKLLGHMMQACIYSYMMGPYQRDEECTLMYFYPDIVSNKYLIIAYDIYWEELLLYDDGWDIPFIMREYYLVFLSLVERGANDDVLKKFRSGVHPMCDDNGKNLKVKDIISKGIARTRMLIAGGESTKEITSYALDQFLPGQKEQTPLEC
jgi:hypothetical protein